MWLLGIGIILLVMKWMEYGPVAAWSWWVVLIPFGLAFMWFEVFEALFGLDKKKAHDQVEEIKQERIKNQLKK